MTEKNLKVIRMHIEAVRDCETDTARDKYAYGALMYITAMFHAKAITEAQYDEFAAEIKEAAFGRGVG